MFSLASLRSSSLLHCPLLIDPCHDFLWFRTSAFNILYLNEPPRVSPGVTIFKLHGWQITHLSHSTRGISWDTVAKSTWKAFKSLANKSFCSPPTENFQKLQRSVSIKQELLFFSHSARLQILLQWILTFLLHNEKWPLQHLSNSWWHTTLWTAPIPPVHYARFTL